MRDRDLTDEQWALIQPWLPHPARRRSPGAHLPERYGDASTWALAGESACGESAALEGGASVRVVEQLSAVSHAV